MKYKEGFIEIKEISHVFTNGSEIVILGSPDNSESDHNCDWMGCNSVMCVLFRGFMVKSFPGLKCLRSMNEPEPANSCGDERK
jgi:hypothetical protein